MEIQSLLQKSLDMTEFQVDIYMSLLKKTATAGQLLKRLNINRATLYRVLDELAEKGLIIKHQTGKRFFYEAIHPDKLLDIYNEKKISFEEKGILLQRAIYDLIRRAGKKPTNTSIKLEKGVYAHYRSMKLQLSVKDKILRQKTTPNTSLYDYSAYPELRDYSKFLRSFINHRLENDIFLKQMVHNPTIESYKDVYYTDKNLLKEVRILPEEILPDISFKVFDDYTIITLHSKSPEDIVLITIHDATVAALMKTLYDFIFDRSIVSERKTPLPTVNVSSNVSVPKLGLGSSGIGGYWNKLHSYTNDISDMDQIRHAISKGIRYIDTCLLYGEGHSVEVIGKAIKNIPRDQIFITGKLTRPGNKLVSSTKDIEDQCNKYLKTFGIDYLDQFQIHSQSSLNIPEKEVVQKIGELITEGKVKNWGVGNYRSVEDLERVQSYIPESLFANELPYGVYERTYEDNGVIEYMRSRNILTIAYFSMRKGGLLINEYDENHPIVTLANKYKKSPAQIALNWVTHQPLTMAIVKSTNGTHINENVQSQGWDMEDKDYELISNLR